MTENGRPTRRARGRRAQLAAPLCGLILCAAALITLVGASAQQQQTTTRQQSPQPSSRQSQQPSSRPQPSPAASPQAARPARTPLTEQERRGKSIYMRGESGAGREIIAVMGEVDVPGSTLTCAGCHGARAEGKTEGGVTAGALPWPHLVKPYGHVHPSGRKHGPFDEMSFIRSVTAGVDPAGNTLLVAMPRYRMSAEDMSDLIAYLKRVETDTDPGVADDALTLGLLVPSKGALAEAGQAARLVTAAYFDDLNRRGGLYNRKIELKVAEAGDTPASAAAGLERLIQEGQIFAVVNAFTAGAEAETAAVVARHEVPVVGSFTLLTPSAATPARHIFYLTPGIDTQARALVNFAAARHADARTRSAVVHARNVLSQSTADAVAAQLAAAGRAAPAVSAYDAGKFDASAAVSELKRGGAQVVFFLGAGEESKFLAEAARAEWFPTIYLLGAMAGGGVLDAPAAFKDKIFLAFPTIPSDITAEGMARFRALAAAQSLPTRHVSTQLAALAGAHLLTEALKRAGQDLTREKLITALEGFYEYETGLTPPLTYGPNRRVGAAGAYVVAADLEKKQYAPVGGWVSVK